MKNIPNILIMGATGKLGTMLLNFCNKESIKISAITCFKDNIKLKKLKNKFKIKNSYTLSLPDDHSNFLNFLIKNKIDIVYFLDVGSSSLLYLNHFLKFQRNSLICIANKEMIIAGGKFINKKIKKNECKLIPLDSEHFSLINNNFNANNIKKIFITASGGPFYFKKKTNLNKVSKAKVLSHPKWKMGSNNLIDSSNFVNKILEIFELSYIYDIPFEKIDFVVSKEAFVHSIILYRDSTISLNCFTNDMLITLTKPLTNYFDFDLEDNFSKIYQLDNFKLEIFNDKRFAINKYFKKISNFNHNQQILFMILNNLAQKLYLNNKLRYNEILNFVFKQIELFDSYRHIKLKNFKEVLKFINDIKVDIKSKNL